MISLKEALLFDDIPPTVLASLLLDDEVFEKAWLLWDPVVLWGALEERVGAPISRAQKDKIMASRVAIKTDAALTQWPAFLNTCFAFNGLSAAPDALIVPSPQMIAWALDELRDIGGDPLEPDAEAVLSPHVSKVICSILFENGLAYVPERPMGIMIAGDMIEYLTRYNPEFISFALDAKAEYEHVSGGQLPTCEPGSPLAVHTAKLISIDVYVTEKRIEKERALNV